MVNVDERMAEMFPPLEFTFNGRVYRIEKVTPESMQIIMGGGQAPRGMWPALYNLSKLFGVDPEEFADVDARELAVLASEVEHELTEQITGAKKKLESLRGSKSK